MAFSRFRRFQRRPSFGRRPFRRHARVPTETRRVEAANFFQSFVLSVPNNASNTTNLTLILANTRNLADPSTTGGRSIIQQVRGIEVSRLVLSYFCESVNESFDPGAGFAGNPLNNELYCRQNLIVDRLTAAGAPAATAAQWNDNQVPVSQTDGTFPIASAEDTDYPMRLLWHKVERVGYSLRDIEDPAEGTIYFVDGQRVKASVLPQINKRLKLFITDDIALCWQWSMLTGDAYGTSEPRSFRLNVQGTLYYRVRY